MEEVIRAIPTLSAEGWVVNRDQRADRALAYTLIAEASQSTMFRGHVLSLQNLIREHQGRPENLEESVRSKFDTYFSRYFESVQTEVNVVSYPNEESNVLALRIYIRIAEDNKVTSLGSIVNFINGKFQKVTAINEGKQ